MATILQVLAIVRGLFDLIRFGKKVVDELEDKDECDKDAKPDKAKGER